MCVCVLAIFFFFFPAGSPMGFPPPPSIYGDGHFPRHTILAWRSRENGCMAFEGSIWLLQWKNPGVWGAWEDFLLLAGE